jgi:hypothetical protein
MLCRRRRESLQWLQRLIHQSRESTAILKMPVLHQLSGSAIIYEHFAKQPRQM